MSRKCLVCASSLDGRHPHAQVCSKECRAERQREHRRAWGMRNREKLSEAGREYAKRNADRYAEYSYKRRYGLSFAEVEAMWLAQDSSCLVCTNPLALRGRKSRCKAVVDHCHATGKVRGLLCTPCNLLIGYAKDDTAVLSRAIKYLEAA